MKKYQGGETSPRGVYLNLSTWELDQLYGENHVLPGNGKVKYIKVPGPLAVIGGPFAGLVFILFLPFIGIMGVLSFIAYKIGWAALVLGRKTMQPVMFSWNPGRAYLTRKGALPQGKAKDDLSKELPNMRIAEIEEEISKRRQRGEK